MIEIPVTQIVIIAILLLVPIVPNLFAIWHAFHCDFKNPYEKPIWLLLAVFLPFIGGLIYLFWGRRRGVRVI